MSDEVINIVLTCDDKYAQHAAVTIVSVVKNTKRKVHFYVFDCGILPENLERLKQLDVGSNVLEVIRVQKIDVFENYEYPRCYSPAIMYRLAIPKILPHLDKALYLDSDVIAVGDVGLIWDIDLGDKMLAGGDALELYGDKLADRELGFCCGKVYFFTSLLLMSLKKMREWHFFEKMIEMVKRSPRTSLPDQDILYLLLEDCHWKILGRHFFVFMTLQHPIFPAVCYHCTYKPWLFPEVVVRFLPGMFCCIMYKYYKYLRFTPWADCKNKYIDLQAAVKILIKRLFRRDRMLDMGYFQSIIEEIKKA